MKSEPEFETVLFHFLSLVHDTRLLEGEVFRGLTERSLLLRGMFLYVVFSFEKDLCVDRCPNIKDLLALNVLIL